ncbi:MAG: tetratricopeptide repeat protein [Candidatus Azotimanducaceae bacterium]
MAEFLTIQETLKSAKSALKRKDFDKARYLFEAILRSDPKNSLAKKKLKSIRRTIGEIQSSIPQNPSPLAIKNYIDSAMKLFSQQRFSDAEALCRGALESSNSVLLLNILGMTLHKQGNFTEAVKTFRRAIKSQPDYADSYSNIGHTFESLGEYEQGIKNCKQAIQLDPKLASAFNNLGINQRGLGLPRLAIESIGMAISLNPKFIEAHNNLGNVYGDIGSLEAAIECYERSIRLNSSFLIGWTNYLYTLNQVDSVSRENKLEVATRYGSILSGMVTKKFRHNPEPTLAKLRVGLVSGDFRNHPVGYFVEGFTSQINKERIEFFAYSANPIEDSLTLRVRKNFSRWRNCFGIEDPLLAQMIYEDGINILVDLSGHTQFNRLPVFAWKPAPVQVTWGGYFATTGVSEMDYILGDPLVTPEGEQHHFVENIWRLPNHYFCFTVPEFHIAVSELPALSKRQITFGSFNNLIKMNDLVYETWSKILKSVKNSRLFLKTKALASEEERGRVARRFLSFGVGEDQLILEGPSARRELLEAYKRVDISLDPFPYPGGATSAESLWMGVPVLTLKGSDFLSHVGESVVHSVGYSEWIANDLEHYVDLAIRHGADITGLSKLRPEMRARVLSSPLFDARLFASEFERAVQEMHQRWRANYLNDLDL